MDTGSLFLLLGLSIFVVLFIIHPFFTRKGAAILMQDHKFSELLAERKRLINALKELDFDCTLGKIPDEDYLPQRRLLLSQAVEVFRQLEAQRDELPEAIRGSQLGIAEALRQADIDQPRFPSPESSRKPIQGEHSPDDELEALIATRRRERLEKSSGFCPQCGHPVQQSDRYCSKCGASIIAEIQPD